MNILLVEGKKDATVIQALCDKACIKTSIIDQIESYDSSWSFAIFLPKDSGDDKVLTNIQRAIIDNIKIMGVVLDADKPKDKPSLCVDSRLQAIQSKLNKLNKYYQKKLQKNPLGIVIEGHENLPRFGVWLMPDNQNAGMLEDFLMRIVKKPEKCIDFAEQCVADAENKDCCTFKAAHRSKAIIHTYLAWQDEPGNTLELSIKTGKLDSTTKIATDFVNWIKRLFIISGLT